MARSDVSIMKGASATVALASTRGTTAPPTISSLNYVYGDIAGGGQSIIITGTSLDSASACTIGGNSATITAQSSTSLTVTLPAHAAGAVDVVVTNPGGSVTSVGAFTYWSPVQITNVFAHFDAEKGITDAGSGKVSQWLDQVSAAAFTQGVNANRPVHTASMFGTLHSVKFTPQQWLAGTGFSAQSQYSYFAVAKWTSSDASAAQPTYQPPLTIVGGSGGWSGFGANSGTISLKKYDAAEVARGSGLNDGNPHLIGVTADGTPNIKIYKGAVQQGATATPGGTLLAYFDTLGAGFSNVDGFDGDVGAIIAVAGVISGGDLTILNAWAAQRFNTV